MKEYINTVIYKIYCKDENINDIICEAPHSNILHLFSFKTPNIYNNLYKDKFPI